MHKFYRQNLCIVFYCTNFAEPYWGCFALAMFPNAETSAFVKKKSCLTSFGTIIAID